MWDLCVREIYSIIALSLLIAQGFYFRQHSQTLVIFLVHLDMKTTFVLLLSACLGALAANNSQTGVKKSSQDSDKSDGKVVVNQLCNSGATTAEITFLKKQLEAVKKELTQQLDKKDTKGKKILFIEFDFR